MNTITVQALFELGMKRAVPEITDPSGPRLHIAPGIQKFPDEVTIDRPEYDADFMSLPFEDESFSVVSAFHFLEHVRDPVKVLLDIQRVLRPGGVANIVVPYYSAQIAYQDLEHRTFWTEQTFENLFRTRSYARAADDEWRFDIGFQMIAGVVERNLCLMAQLIRTE